MGDLHKNNLLYEKTHKIILWLNYFTSLTLLCSALAKDATPIYVTPMGEAPHIVGWQARAATYDRMCGALAKGFAKGVTQIGVAPLRKAPHKRVRIVK